MDWKGAEDSAEYRITRRTALKLASVAGVGAVFSGSALADDRSPEIEAINPESPPPWEQLEGTPDRWAENLWFVEFGEPPTARGGNPPEHANERARLQTESGREGVTFDERGDFTTLWNGLSIRADLAGAIVLSGLNSVNAVYPVAVVDHPDPEEASPALDSALAMTGSDAAQSELGLTGDGLSVAIVDTGIDYNHPDLGGDGNQDVTYTAESRENRLLTDSDGERHSRVSHGWDYVGAGFEDADSTPDPNPDPMDPQGHGTHVAGITGADAADDGVTGVAPESTLGAYKVFDIGSTTADIIVAAMEDAYEDGMDIVNMSLGASLAWGREYPTSAASNELADQGVVVVNSAGNDGGLGAWSLSAPANAHDIISVASAENTELEAFAFEVDQFDDSVPYQELSGAEEPPTEGESAPLGLPSATEDGVYLGCEPEDFADFPADHVALIERGECPFAEKYQNAVDAGAVGVVIYNDVPGLFSGTVGDDGVEGVWGAGISQSDGEALVDLLEDDEEVTLEFTDEIVTVPNPEGGLLSSFTSYGQDVELAFGPSVTAPGGMITSTYPLELGEYANLSGTSMAAPHVAGAVALLLEEEDLDPLEVRDRLQNTADPRPWSLNPGSGLLDHSFRQGAGMVQIDRAITAEGRVEPGQISLADQETTEVTLTVSNDADQEVVYAVDHVPALETARNTFAPEIYLSEYTVDAPEAVTLPAGETATVHVAISAPESGLPNHQYGGYVVLTPDDEDLETLRVPYAGYDGDYQDLPLFGYYAGVDEFVEQEPRLSEIVYDDGEVVGYDTVDPGHAFDIGEGDYPVVEAFFGHFPQEMRVHAAHQPSGREWLVMEDSYLPRSPTPEDYWPFPWPGVTQAGRSDNVRPVPSGTYTLRVEVLRTLGDPENENHWETWESPAFEVDTRPGRGRSSAPGRSPAISGSRP